MIDSSYDDHKIRCPKLGHLIPFEYCRKMNDGLPCPKIFDCWHEYMDIHGFIAGNYTPDEINTFMEPPKPKINHILELMEKMKNQKG